MTQEETDFFKESYRLTKIKREYGWLKRNIHKLEEDCVYLKKEIEKFDTKKHYLVKQNKRTEQILYWGTEYINKYTADNIIFKIPFEKFERFYKTDFWQDRSKLKILDFIKKYSDVSIKLTKRIHYMDKGKDVIFEGVYGDLNFILRVNFYIHEPFRYIDERVNNIMKFGDIPHCFLPSLQLNEIRPV